MMNTDNNHNNKRLTSDEMLERLKSIIPNLTDNIISLDLQLRPGLAAVIQISREINEHDDLSKRPCVIPINQIEELLAVYNVNDFDDVMRQNEQMKDILDRIVVAHEHSNVDWDAMREATGLLVKLNRG